MEGTRQDFKLSYSELQYGQSADGLLHYIRPNCNVIE